MNSPLEPLPTSFESCKATGSLRHQQHHPFPTPRINPQREGNRERECWIRSCGLPGVEGEKKSWGGTRLRAEREWRGLDGSRGVAMS